MPIVKRKINLFYYYTVDHEVLLKKLYSIGFIELPLKILQNYWKDREPLVRINVTSSTLQSINIGIPQGTIHGPLLFIIYINDILKLLILHDFIVSFANHTVLLCHDVSWSAVYKMLEIFFNLVKSRPDDCILSLNIAKANSITFLTYSDIIPKAFKLMFNNKPISKIQYVKYLRVFLDQYLRSNAKLCAKTKSLFQC